MGLPKAEQAARALPQLRFAIGWNVKRKGVAGTRIPQRPVLVIEHAVDHGDEGIIRQTLVHEIAIEPLQNFVRRDDAIFLADDFFWSYSALEEYGQEAGRNAVTHGVGDIEAQMIL